MRRRYNDFFLDYLLNLFSVAEALELMEANELQRPVTLRTNTLKVRSQSTYATAYGTESLPQSCRPGGASWRRRSSTEG
jgi:16S rRNA C967 or C1407 C5-methylase (RsmB/RsmF family)